MKKYLSDLIIKSIEHLRKDYVLIKVSPVEEQLPPIYPGQFVEIKVNNSTSTFLRRPISVNFVDYEKNELWLLIHVVGEGTLALSQLSVSDKLNCLFPLGNGFTMPEGTSKKILLVGGGVGTAPLLYYGKKLTEAGHQPIFLLGGRSSVDLLQLSEFEKYGNVLTTTEDGSLGVKGFVTHHPIWDSETFDSVATCGPKPMMVAVARMAKVRNITCEASLENMMACGLGACLCCVEKTTEGNLCVCKEGPVFNIERLGWV